KNEKPPTTHPSHYGGRKMTRETKAGIVLSFSFLCLVSAVLVLKMRPGTEASPGAAGQPDADMVALAEDVQPPRPAATAPTSQAATGSPAPSPATPLTTV